MNQFTQILKDRLEKKGLESEEITGFIRDLANVLLVREGRNMPLCFYPSQDFMSSQDFIFS